MPERWLPPPSESELTPHFVCPDGWGYALRKLRGKPGSKLHGAPVYV